MYLMCGQMLEQMGRVDDAKTWLKSGMEAAQKKGDTHALGELEGALGAAGGLAEDRGVAGALRAEARGKVDGERPFLRRCVLAVLTSSSADRRQRGAP